MTDLRGLESLDSTKSLLCESGAADRIAANSPLQMAIDPWICRRPTSF